MASKDDKSVLGNLPSTRPARMSRRREAASARGEAPVATKPKPAPKPKAAAKPAASKPRAVRSGSPSLERAPRKGPEPPKPASSSTPPKGTELVTTTVQAVGELAQIGLTLSGQVAKRALKRLPKP